MAGWQLRCKIPREEHVASRLPGHFLKSTQRQRRRANAAPPRRRLSRNTVMLSLVCRSGVGRRPQAARRRPRGGVSRQRGPPQYARAGCPARRGCGDISWRRRRLLSRQPRQRADGHREHRTASPQLYSFLFGMLPHRLAHNLHASQRFGRSLASHRRHIRAVHEIEQRAAAPLHNRRTLWLRAHRADDRRKRARHNSTLLARECLLVHSIAHDVQHAASSLLNGRPPLVSYHRLDNRLEHGVVGRLLLPLAPESQKRVDAESKSRLLRESSFAERTV